MSVLGDRAATKPLTAALSDERVLAAAARLLVIFGVSFTALVLTYDYFAPGVGRTIGVKAMAALVVGVSSVAVGVALQLVLRLAERAEILRFWAVAGQVLLTVAAIRVFAIENLALYELIAPIVAAGFIVHHYAPERWRPPVFFAVGVICFAGVFGPQNAVAGLWLGGIALAIIGAASLPAPLWMRIALLAAIAVVLAALRAGWIETGWSGVILPVLASMFMFRVVIYLYDSANGKGPKDIWRRLSYFFLPPNVVFPFFPVVDFATFGRTYYNDEAVRIYQRGAIWMLRGLIHLLLYRVVYLYGVIPPESVASPGGFLWFVTTNFALYLRISGMFHLIVGTILLFGYNLPETHTRFYFSNGFIDFWRRINIYWKDFMQKMVFNPVFLRLRRLEVPQLAGICMAMLAVFFATWALHAYQWFWLRGTVLLTLPDMLFWGLLALFLVIQTLNESRPRPATAAGLLGPRAFRVLRTACTFLTISILWALWTSASFADWGELWIRAGLAPAFAGSSASSIDWAITAATVLAALLVLAITLGFSIGLERRVPAPAARKRPSDARPTLRGVALASVVLVALMTAQTLALRGAPGGPVQQLALSLRLPHLNVRDQALLERGYYENLTNVNQFNSQLWEIYMARPNAISNMYDAPFIRLRSDALMHDYQPGASGVFNDVTYDINQWGMRDAELPKQKPEGTFRIAIDGNSIIVGWGVEIEDRFDRALVPLLQAARGDETLAYQTLNFSVDGYVLSERLVHFSEKAWDFDPDLVLMFGHTRDIAMGHVVDAYMRGAPPDFPFVHELIARAGLRPDMSVAEVERRLDPLGYEFAAGAYRYYAERARERGIPAVWVYLPLVLQESGADAARLKRIAADAGLVVVDLTDVFAGLDYRDIQIARWDTHPNPRGHRLIAERLARELRALEEQGRIELGLVE